LRQAYKDIVATGKKPADVFEPLRAQPTQKSITPKVFADVLKKSVTASTKALLTNDVLKLIIYYLIREVPREVSFTKLYSALNLPEKEPPLK
jgi:predicted AAA+ superfamily ATPase